MADYRRERNALNEERNDFEQFGDFGGSAEEFCDRLDAEQLDFFNELESLAESKRKWLRLFEKMQKQIAAREFDEAEETFEVLYSELA